MWRSKLFFIFIISQLTCSIISAQQSDKQKIDKEDYVGGNRFGLSISGRASTALGDNFIAKGTNVSFGLGIAIEFPIYDGLYAKVSYDQIDYTVNKPEFIGAIDFVRRKNYLVGFGYILDLNNKVYLNAGLAYLDVVNRNIQNSSQGNGNFKDSGEGIQLSFSTGYKVNDFIYVVGFLNCDFVTYETVTGNSRQDFVKKSTFLTSGLALRLTIPYKVVF